MQFYVLQFEAKRPPFSNIMSAELNSLRNYVTYDSGGQARGPTTVGARAVLWTSVPHAMWDPEKM